MGCTWTATSSRERAQTFSRARTQWRVRDVGRGRNSAYGMLGADPVGDSGKAGADGKDGRARTRMRKRFCGRGRKRQVRVCGRGRFGQYSYVGADATAGIGMRVRT
jgi:hypothetical protein